LGRNLNARIWLVVHSYRHDDVIRLISARMATPGEQATF
jgi:uncharacterized DUF497 family protein